MTDSHAGADPPWWLAGDVSRVEGVPPAHQAQEPGPGGPPRPKSRFGGARVRATVAIVAVLGIAIGLLVAQPWQSPPLLAPVKLTLGPPTATSVRVSWQVAPGSLTPDGFLVLRDGRQVASTPGTALSYVDHGLIPGGTYAYRIEATSGGQRSKASSRVATATAIPAPGRLTQTGRDWTSVTLTWSPPPDAPAPDRYEVIDESNSGTIVAVVSGQVHSYTVRHLSPGDSGKYDVDAVWSGRHSGTTPAITASARVAPLDHDYSVTYTTVVVPGGGASLHVGQKWTDQWTFSPVCAGAQCSAMKVQVNFDPPKFVQNEISITLQLAGGSYVGTTKSQVTTCGGVQSTSPLVPSVDPPTNVTNTITMVVAPEKTLGGAWTVWRAAMQLSSPDTIHHSLFGGPEECPSQSWYFTVAGHPAVGA